MDTSSVGELFVYKSGNKSLLSSTISRPGVCVSPCLCVCVCLSVCMSVCVWVSMCLYVIVSLCVSVYVCPCVSVCASAVSRSRRQQRTPSIVLVKLRVVRLRLTLYASTEEFINLLRIPPRRIMQLMSVVCWSVYLLLVLHCDSKNHQRRLFMLTLANFDQF